MSLYSLAKLMSLKTINCLVLVRTLLIIWSETTELLISKSFNYYMKFAVCSLQLCTIVLRCIIQLQSTLYMSFVDQTATYIVYTLATTLV